MTIMSAKSAQLHNDTQVHVAQFLREGIGAIRQSQLRLDELVLDDDATAHRVAGTIRLTRIPVGILVRGQLTATTTLECGRCVEEFDYPIATEFADEYRPTIDILTGAEVAHDALAGDEQEYFTISDLHLLDIRESLRQALTLALPMAPLCREDCPGLPELTTLTNEADSPLAILGQLLATEDVPDDHTELNGRGALSATRRAPRKR